MAPKVSRKTQIGREATAGTLADATIVWRGNTTFEDVRNRVYVDEQIGIDGGTGRQYDTTLGAKISFEDTPLTDTHLLHILEAGIKTATPTGAGPYVYTYPFPTTAAQTLKTYTIEVGDSFDEWEAEYCFVTSLGIKGSSAGGSAEACMMNAEWLGRQWTRSNAFTAALVPTTVDDLMFTKATCALGAVGTAFGSLTTVTAGFLGFDFKMETGFRPRFTGDGSLYFTLPVWNGNGAITCDVSLEYGSVATAEIVNFEAGTPRKLEIICTGSSASHIVKLQMVGSWEKWSSLEDIDEGDTITGTFRVHYDATATARGNIVVTSALSAVP